MNLPPSLPPELEIQSFNLIPGPGSLSQELQTGLDAWIIIKTPDSDDPSHFIPAIMLYQLIKHHFQRNTMKRIIGLPVAHLMA